MNFPATFLYVRVTRFLAALADGWEFPHWIIEPCDAGGHSVLMVKEEGSAMPSARVLLASLPEPASGLGLPVTPAIARGRA